MEAFIGKRIMVIGSPGSGKSHFSAELSYRTGLPLFRLDRNFRPDDAGKWEIAEAQRFVEWQKRTVEDDEWIFDGNYNGTMRLRLSRADTVFCFDLPRLICLFSYFRRLLAYPFLPGASKKDEDRGGFDMKFVKYIWKFKQTELFEKLHEYPGLRVFIFRRSRDKKRFFADLEAHLAREREERLKEFMG